MSGLDEYLARKQLPLRQQADKPILKYSTISTPITKPVPLFSQSDIQALKYGGISTPFRDMPTRNAQINKDSVTKVASPTKITSNPYARPLSAKDLENVISQTQPMALLQRQHSNSNIFTGSVSPVKTVTFTTSTQSSVLNSSIQTNSFMRPQSALRKDHDSSDSSGSRHSILRPPSTTGMAGTYMNGVTRSPSQTSSNSRHSVTFADDVDVEMTPVQNDSQNDIPNGILTKESVSLNSLSSGFVTLKEAVQPGPPVHAVFEDYDRQNSSASSNEFMRKFAQSEAGSKHVKQIASQVHAVKTEILNNNNNSLGDRNLNNSKSDQKSYADNSQSVSLKSKIVRDRDMIFRPPSPKRPATPTSQQMNKVRNPRYTPTKPYSEVSDCSMDEPMADDSLGCETPQSEAPLSSPVKGQNFHAPGLIAKPPKSGSLKTPQNAQNKDGTMKKMPVTNTITGTIYYRKGSKVEEVLHEQRPKGDGAPDILQKVEKLTSNDGEEWEDEEEEGDAESDNYPNSERLPGDGEAFEDDIDDDDGIDNLDDDIADGSDDESAYSITSSTSPSRQSSARARVHSATKRLMRMSIKEGERPIITSRRPTSAKSPDGEIQPALAKSLFTNVPPTVNFVPDGERVEQLPWEIRKLLKWRISPITPNIVKHTIARSGFRITKKNYDWLGCWGKHMKAQGFKTIREYQKINHFPGSFQIGRKDRLWRNLSKMQCHFGKKEFGFFPQTYVLPFDMKLLKRAWDDGGTKQKWIIKPPASARGIGIRVIHKWQQIPKRRPVIVQRYLSKPYLINDSKFDLRVYVYVTSYDPLRIYVFEDGLVRFASQKYSSSMKNLSNKFMHLTNYSINKRNNEYQANTDETVCQGHKWGLKALWAYMKRQGVNTAMIWESIKDVVVKTIVCAESAINTMIKTNVRRRYCIHELFGFDIFLDENLKPWILEVNISPSLHSNSQLDINIKGNMIKDLLNIAGFLVPDKSDVVPTPSLMDNCSRTEPSNEVCMDKRLSNQPYSSDERAKHTYYCQRFNDEGVQATILDILTPDDMRMLIETIDEDSRKGQFQRVFPTPASSRYLKFMEQPRYYNLLLDAWSHKYHKYESRGNHLLEQYCKKGIHLDNPTTDPHHHWVPPTSTPRTQSAPMAKNRLDSDLRSNSSSSVAKRKKLAKKSASHSSSLSSMNNAGLPPRPPISGQSSLTKS